MADERVELISITLPPDLAWQLRILAAHENKSRSQFVRELLEKAILRRDLADDPGVGQHQEEQVQDV